MKSGRPEAGEFAEYATSDIDFVAGDDAVGALRAQSTLLDPLSRDEWLRRGIVNGYEASVRGLAFHIAGHELHHLRTLRERYLA